MKKWVTGVLAGAMALAMSATAFAGTIFVDLNEVKSDTAPQIVNGRTMVPVRAISEMLGYRVSWIQDKQQVEVFEADAEYPCIIMNIDSTTAYYEKYEPALDDTIGAEATLDAPATIINGRTFVPLRFISEAVGYDVEYIAETGDIHLFSPAYKDAQEGEGIGTDDGYIADKSEEYGEGIGTDYSEPFRDIFADADYDENTLAFMSKMEYLYAQDTDTWLAMSDDEKAYAVAALGVFLEYFDEYVVEDYDQLWMDLDHQMEQYYRNGVNESLVSTVYDMYELEIWVE